VVVVESLEQGARMVADLTELSEDVVAHGRLEGGRVVADLAELGEDVVPHRRRHIL
jgi:hypothetical protein